MTGEGRKARVGEEGFSGQSAEALRGMLTELEAQRQEVERVVEASSRAVMMASVEDFPGSDLGRQLEQKFLERAQGADQGFLREGLEIGKAGVSGTDLVGVERQWVGSLLQGGLVGNARMGRLLAESPHTSQQNKFFCRFNAIILRFNSADIMLFA
jgi:hypothetical protein